MSRKKSILTVVIFASLLLIFTVADFFNKDRIFSDNENRVLAEKPDFSFDSVFSGKYSKEYETYTTDQFAWRDRWISLKTYTDIILGKKDINGIYLADDDYLIEKHSPNIFSHEDISKKIGMLVNFLRDFPDTKIMLAPTADNILTDKLPSHATYFDQRSFLELVKNETDNLNPSAVINLCDILSAHKNEEIYYKTDHHWTSLGAYYAYLAWADASSVTPFPYDTNTLKTVTDDFKGTLHSKINIENFSDTIHAFSETYDFDVDILYDNTINTSSLYEDKYLKSKNKYGYFLDDNHGIVEITNNKVTDENMDTLVILKDSYANSFIPLLVPHYEKIYVIDLRYFREDVTEFIQKFEKTDTLILYNCIHFLEDFKYDLSVKRL